MTKNAASKTNQQPAQRLAPKAKFVSDGNGGVRKAAEPSNVTTARDKPAVMPTPRITTRETAGVAATPAVESTPASAPATASKKPTYDARMRKLPHVERVRRKVGSTIKRFANLAAILQGWTNAQELANAANVVLTHLDALHTVAKNMPDSFVPQRAERGARQESAIADGAPVTIRTRVRPEYEGVIDLSKPLTVIETRKGKVVCKTADGEKVFIPRAHLATMADAAATPDALSDEEQDELEADELGDEEGDEDEA